MLILGLDTATPWGTIALGDSEETFFEITLKSGKGGGEYLLSLLEHFFAKSGKDLSEVDLIAVGTGPGSYTGIRVGLAAVRGLAEGLKIPAVGISTLRIIAENCIQAAEWVAVVLDARRGSVYAALYQNGPQGFTEYWKPSYSDIAGFSERLAELPEVMVCGDGSKIYQETLAKIPGVKVGPNQWDRPAASNLVWIANNQWRPGMSDLLDLSPSYLRKVEAEVRLEERTNADGNNPDETGRPK
ncbi:MAG: tRNA (adenosine(37)-N6)-threonylcarbamoyltransferase complex dimerization subunit type 1 TsaB [Firmicutes bacterium]|nr:tRNA (adenosine(37)-N6)-threonylcarbamoyltransferase complex dimerization subunit type 1 TsaB [Bacillota bacterium]